MKDTRWHRFAVQPILIGAGALEIEYTELDEKVKLDPAPYLRVGLKYGF